MSLLNIDDILPFVEKPSRYLGSEINTVKKDLNRVQLRFALAFPDLYEIGSSHFGMQILYHILNDDPDIAAERVFAPGVDMETALRKTGKPLFSLESCAPINRFDIIGFSLLYELNYTNVLTILDLGQIPFLAADRDDSYPVVIAGGPCVCNPEPIADLFDAMVVGDGERVIKRMAAEWLDWQKERQANKVSLLQRWSQIEGVYIPSFFKFSIDDRGFQTLKPQFSNYTQVKRAIVDDLNRMPFPDKPIVPYGKPVHDRLRLEVSRGCTRGCRFCQAGMIYRPVRERSPEHLMALAAGSLGATGYEDISLLSLSTGDYGCIAPLMERLMVCFASDNVAVSLPSLRAGTLTPELMRLIKMVRKTGFTIAPEAGSQRLRDVINKNISENEIIGTVQDAFRLGWQVIKLYFMIGLPTETDDDLHALVDLVKKLAKIKGPNKKRGKINVSVATFIPKAHTPFQWARQISLTESRSKINWLHDRLKIPGIRFKWQDPRVSRLEGLWARGDRRLSRLLTTAYKKGCKFDGWSDKFNYDLWQAAFEEENIDPDFYSARMRDISEPLPWDHIDNRVSKSFLKHEWQNALENISTVDCRQGLCHQCGTCDFEKIEVKTYPTFEAATVPSDVSEKDHDVAYQTMCVSYAKHGRAKYFGHLEMVNIFLRALKRAKIPVKFTQGYHPKPKISFDDPLPIGIESEQEHFMISLPVQVEPETVTHRLNLHLPEGLAINSSQIVSSSIGCQSPAARTYRVSLDQGDFHEENLISYSNSDDFFILLSNRKGKLKKVNLKDMVKNIALIDSKRLQVTLTSEPGKSIRPEYILRHIFDLKGDQIKRARVVKLKN
ncbi:MAG: TIGR03960 family B12-binding radical SAM protein [Desulfobacterales bacterium]|nr:MAG: TIGR03960 family B12-binding radical SAM protein [Desulfobacterales bacterium]